MFNKNHFTTLILFLLFSSAFLVRSQDKFVTAKPKPGDGLYLFLERYHVSLDRDNIDYFREINKGKLDNNGNIFLHQKYKLPILIYKYNGTSIRSTIGMDDYDYAISIQDYNDLLFEKGIKENDYRKDKVLFVPKFTFKTGKKKKFKSTISTEKLFGVDNKKVKIIDKKLKKHIYYLVAGHGGPDPGAIGHKDGKELWEHEYAYDVTLRLARCLMEHSAKVFLIVQDKNDGIRNDVFLKGDQEEKYFGGEEIAYDQISRLRKRAEIVNYLHKANRKKARYHHAIMIHVDSRIEEKLIDVFFYHAEGSRKGEKLANTLLKTMKNKYDQHQPGRGYQGSVSTRNLYMLNAISPLAIYIELGNIQNPRNQIRILEASNRQAIAEWLCEGMILNSGK